MRYELYKYETSPGPSYEIKNIIKAGEVTLSETDLETDQRVTEALRNQGVKTHPNTEISGVDSFALYFTETCEDSSVFKPLFELKIKQ